MTSNLEIEITSITSRVIRWWYLIQFCFASVETQSSLPCSQEPLSRSIMFTLRLIMYKVVQIWSGQTVTSLHTISPGHVWTTLYL
jgi:hypothetical protein